MVSFPTSSLRAGRRGLHWYVWFCRWCAAHLGGLGGDPGFRRRVESQVSREFMDALNFTGLEVEPHETRLGAYGGLLFSGALLGALDVFYLVAVQFYWVEFSTLAVGLLALLTLGVPLGLLLFLSEYPKVHAGVLRIRSLGDAPEVLGYVVMSMKLVPNLERAVRFAAEHSERQLSRDLRKLLWDLQIRVHVGLEEAWGWLADRWGGYSESFARALHLIRSSTGEPDEAQRMVTLNRALEVVLEGTRDAMEGFAAKLGQPALVLFSLFIMVPLSLVAMLPAAGLVGFRITLADVVLLYDLALPLGALAYSERILRRRPATFAPLEVPPGHPALQGEPPLARRIAVAIGVGVALGFPAAISLLGWLAVPWSLPLLWGLCGGLSYLLVSSQVRRERVRREVRAMEREFADALFMLGRRIGEGRPAEEAFAFAARSLEGAKIAVPFRQVVYNLATLRCTLERALFDPEYGAFRDIPSDRIRATLRLLVESVERSPPVAGAAIVRLADHLKELQGVEERMRHRLSEVTSVMRSTIAAFAPLVAGATVALGEAMDRILARAARSLGELGPTGEGVARGLAPGIPTDGFILAVGLYILFLCALLVRFTVAVEEGGDRSRFLTRLGTTLPVATGVFTASTLMGRVMFGSILGGL